MTTHQALKGWYRYHLVKQADRIIDPYRKAALQRLATSHGYASIQEMDNKDRSNQWQHGYINDKYTSFKVKMINDALAKIGVTPIASTDIDDPIRHPAEPTKLRRSDSHPSSGAEYAV
jgi:hypothetical protein